eukprot:m51a1_g2561 hypothetical protein (249) ;mRNA; r:339381-340527
MSSASLVGQRSTNVQLTCFRRDCTALGTLKAFKFFEAYIRGKEELLLTVRSRKFRASRDRLVLPQQTQGIGKLSVGSAGAAAPQAHSAPPSPASPCLREIESVRRTLDTVFLVGSYSRYGRPCVWLRSRCFGLGPLGGEDDEGAAANDVPLNLESLADWDTRDVEAWEVVEEVVASTLDLGDMVNVFAVDHAALRLMDPVERMLAAGALVDQLWSVYSAQRPYSSQVLDDIRLLADVHFSGLCNAAVS